MTGGGAGTQDDGVGLARRMTGGGVGTKDDGVGRCRRTAHVTSLVGTVETMPKGSHCVMPQQEIVHGRGLHSRIPQSSRRRRHTLSAMLTMLAFLAVWFVSLPVAFGDDATSPSDPSPTSEGESGSSTVTEDITDPDNLLGDSVTQVKDAISRTARDEGVHVRLLYLPSFGEGVEPDAWASEVLEATGPEPNTVMLAVGSDDGNLVVAVSKNSDEWLLRQDTVDQLSDAAVAPIQHQPPDWAGSALALMDELATLHHTSTSSGLSRAGVIALTGILVGLVVLAVVAVVVRRLWRAGNRRAHVKRRHATAGAPADGDGENVPHTTESSDAGDIQKTFSKEDDA